MGSLSLAMEFAKNSKKATVETKTIGKVDLLPMKLTSRLHIQSAAAVEGSFEHVLLVIAYSWAEKGVRLSDSMDVNELVSILDDLGMNEQGMEDLNLLFSESNKLSKSSTSDVEEAVKN